MKKLLFLFIVLTSYFGYSQGGPRVDLIKFQGQVTTTVRNTILVTTGETWLIWNVTTGQFEYAGDDEVWTALDTDDQTATEVAIADAGGIITATTVEGALQENRTAINLNTAKVTNATHTGEVTGSGALTIADNIIEEANLEATNVATDNYILSFDSASGGFTWIDNAADVVSVTGTPTNYSITLTNAQDHFEGIDAALGALAGATSLPVADGTSIAEGSTDATKEVRFEVDTHVPTATTVVLSAPSANLDLNDVVVSSTSGEPSGFTKINNMGSITQANYDAGTPVSSTYYVITDPKTPEVIQIAASDLTSDLTTGTGKAYFRMPWAATLTGVRASLSTAPTGAAFIVDINEGGTSVLSTKLTIDNLQKTSTTSASSAVISDSALADDAEITIDIDQIGSGGTGLTGQGLIVTLYVEY